MEMEAVTHALRLIASRSDSQTTPAIILTDSMSLLQKMKNKVGRLECLYQCSTSTFKNSLRCTALDMPESTKMTEQIDWWAKQPSQLACIL